MDMDDVIHKKHSPIFANKNQSSQTIFHTSCVYIIFHTTNQSLNRMFFDIAEH